MATITGSSTLNWSNVTLDPNAFKQKVSELFNRVEQTVAAYGNGTAQELSSTSTFILVRLSSDEVVTLRGSGIHTTNLVIKSFDYSNSSTGEVLHSTGTVKLHIDSFSPTFVNITIDSITLGSVTVINPDGQATIIGNIVVDPVSGDASGSISQLKEKIGSTTVTIKGNLSLSVSDVISGTVTDISVVSGANTILMSGLSVDYSALDLDSVTTANDLFSAVGNLMSGNDTITYTNNSGVGMTFFGGGGNDTITISGPNADTLNGGDGNDILIGGLGQDTVNGGAGDDQITMLVTTGNEDTIDAGADTDTLVLSGVVPGDHVVVVDLSSSTDQVVSIGGVADALTQINVENLTASGLGSSVTVTGNDGDNIIIGSKGNDSIDGGAGNDTIIGGLGSDTLQGSADNDLFPMASAAEFAAGEMIDGGTGTDTLRYTGNAAATLTLTNLVTNLEQVKIDNAALLGTGLAAINVNAAAVTSNGMTLVGNDGTNVLTGTSQTDTLIGNGGNDVFLIGAAADHGGSEVITGGVGVDVIRFTSTTSDETLVLNSNVTEVESVVIGTPAGVTTGLTALNVDASNVATALTITGNAGANVLTGTSANDTLNGGAGNDTLDGGLGTNLLRGGTGNDSYVVNATTDVVSEGLAAGTDTVLASLNYTLGANVENLELTGSALNGTGNTLANILTGNSDNNTLSGLAGNDQLIGGAGQDTVTGGTENDRIVMQVTAGDVDIADGGAGSDTLVLVGVVGGDGIVVVNLAAGAGDQVTSIGGAPDALVQNNFEHLDASGLGSSVNATGSAGANLLIGSDGNDILNGAAGNDTLDGGAGDDTLNGGDGNDVFLIGAAADHGGSEVITGGVGVDVIRFTSTTSDETLVLNSNVTEVESVVIGTPAGVTTGLTALNVDASNVATALTITGNAGANVLTGTSANDTLNGGAGNDTLDGGLGTNLLRGGTGNDSYIVDALTNVVSEGLAAGTDTVVASLNYTLGTNVENLELTGSANLNGTGNTLANVLTGNDGSNVLSGGVGNDTLVGGLDEDTVNGGTENDRIVMQVTAGDVDVADGGAGSDTLVLVGVVGGDGIVVVNLAAGVGDQVTSIGGAPDGLVQNNFENLDASGLVGSSVNVTGSAGINIITGSSGTDQLTGNGGNDVFLIGDAADHGVGEVIDGGAGTDVLRFTSSTAGQTLVLASGVTAVESVVIGTPAGVTTGLTALNVDASNVATALTITGNAGANVLTGTSANDTLNGGAGNDTLDGGLGINLLRGGTGNDSFVVNATTDVVSEGLAAGIDTVLASLNYTLGANVENLELTGSDPLTGTGNALNNSITGNDGSNVLNGGVGNDQLIGGAGQDTVNGGTENDRIVMQVTAGDVDVADGGAGLDTLALVGAVDGDGVVVVDLSSVTDQVTRIGTVDPESLVQKNFENLDASGLGSAVNATGSAGANLLIGSDGNDTLNGGAGNDTLNGGVGDDTLNGGIGNDTFLFGSGDGQDLVQDNSGSADKILFAGGINPLDLVLSRQANDLRLAIHGSSDQITVQDWYTSSVNRTETIQAGNGEILLSAQVDQLIQAMAGFTQLTGLTWDQAIDQQPQEVQTVLAASWQ